MIRQVRTILVLILVTSVLNPLTAWAKENSKKAASSALLPEALGAKTLLEDMLARRYAQELSTTVDRQSFSVAAQLDLVELPKPIVKPTPEPSGETEPLSDLMLGTLDPDELMKKYAGSADDHPPTLAKGFLENFRIRSVQISVGLKEDLPATTKTDVERWLTARVESEFGKAGKGLVSLVKVPNEKSIAPKTLLDYLSQFQSLAGQLVTALAVICAVLLWQLLSKPETTANTTQGGEAQVTAGGALDGSLEERENAKRRKQEEEELQLKASVEIENLTRRLNELVPRLSSNFEDIMRSWCQMGEAGRFRLACFAEAVGRDLGRLPIPTDAMADVSKVFARMAGITLTEKRDALQKAYWDLLSVMNLGSGVLSQPFGYIGGLNIAMVNQVLMDQNSKMKTLVSLFMPGDMRLKFIQSLPVEGKKELLETAAQLSEISAFELNKMDGSLMSKIKPTGKQDVVPLELTLNKVVAALTPMEEVTLLPSLQGSSIQEFKRSTPSLAFLGEWPDAKLSLLMARVSPDELTAFLRVRGDLKDRLLAVCPSMTAEVTNDELVREDRLSEKDKNAFLLALRQRTQEMIKNQEINLEEIFPVSDNAGGSPFGDSSAPQRLGNEYKKAS